MIIFLAHPVGAETREGVNANVANAKLWYGLFIRRFSVSIIADWITSCETLDDMITADRLRGQMSNARLLTRADELWLCGGRISSGMRNEMLTMHALGKPIRSFLDLGYAPPTDAYIGTDEHLTLTPSWRVVPANWSPEDGHPQ